MQWLWSWFARLFGRKAPIATAEALALTAGDSPTFATGDALRERLFAALAAGDAGFGGLCREHAATVLAEFPGWAVVPAAIRSDPAAVQRYVAGLVGIARFFAEELSERGPLDRLVAPPGGNPITDWHDQLGKASEWMEALEYTRARGLLENLVERARGLSGTAVVSYLPVTLGRLGECRFHQGETEAALGPTEEALALCEAHADLEGVVAYRRNLYEIHRYLGDAASATLAAEALAAALEKLGNGSEAGWYRKQGRWARAGEPENRVVVRVGGQRYELDELPDDLGPTSGTISFEFERNRITLRPAAELTRRAEQLGSEGEYDRALQMFRAAGRADLYDPQCRFLEGLTLGYLERHREALGSYDACETRAAGWYVCRADRWLAQQISDGRFDHGAFLVLRELEQASGSPPRKRAIATRALERYPDLPALYLELGRSLDATKERDAALSAFRSGLGRAPDPDTKTRLLLALGHTSLDRAERIDALTQALLLKGNLVSAAMAQVALTLGPREDAN